MSGNERFRPWRILHLDLAAPVPALEPEPGSGGVHTVVWLGDVALGDVEIPAASLPLTGAALREIALAAVSPAVAAWLNGGEPLVPPAMGAPEPPLIEPGALRDAGEIWPRLRTLWAQRREAAPPESVSVVVCTRDRPDVLAQCLASLRNLNPAPLEILVVDNAPADDRSRSLVASLPGVRYLLEPQPGLSRARNAGVRAARGDIVAFTDDDVVAAPGWVGALRCGFAAGDVLSVTGLVLPARLGSEAEWIFEKEFGGFSQGFAPLIFDQRFFQRFRDTGVPVWRIGAGANMAIRRVAFERVGLFDERLGAGAAGCSEDSEFWYRLLASGHSCRYEPTAIVHHHHRADAAGLSRQMHLYMRGHVAALLVQHSAHRNRGDLHRLIRTLPGHYAKNVIGGLRHGFTPKQRTLRTEFAGCLSGIAFYLRERRTAPYPTSPAAQPNR